MAMPSQPRARRRCVPDAGANVCGVRASSRLLITSSLIIVTCSPAIIRQSVRTTTTACQKAVVGFDDTDTIDAARAIHHRRTRARRVAVAAGRQANQTACLALLPTLGPDARTGQ